MVVPVAADLVAVIWLHLGHDPDRRGPRARPCAAQRPWTSPLGPFGG
jgi:hypothetical protein